MQPSVGECQVVVVIENCINGNSFLAGALCERGAAGFKS